MSDYTALLAQTERDAVTIRELTADAARYRWLKTQKARPSYGKYSDPLIYLDFEGKPRYAWMHSIGEGLDAAIDAARNKS